MRSGMEKRILKKITAITFILILLMQIVMPMFVNAEEKKANIQTQIGYDLDGLNVNFKITQMEKHNDVYSESYTWQKRKNDEQWQDILNSSQKNIQQSRSETKGYQYRCVSQVKIYSYKKLVYDAYTMLLRYGTDHGPDASGYADWQYKLINHTNVEHMLNVVRDTGEDVDGYRQESTSIALSMLISMEYLGDNWNRNGGDGGRNGRKEENVRELINRLSIFFKRPEGATEYEYTYWTNEYFNYKDSCSTWEYDLIDKDGNRQQYTRGMLYLIKCISTESISLNTMNQRYGYNYLGYKDSYGTMGRFKDTIGVDIDTYTSESNVITIPEYPVNLTLINGTGIESVSGAGQYNAGDVVNIGANVKTGYTWTNWTGHSNANGIGQNGRFTVPYEANVTLTANADPISYTVAYNGNGNTGGSTPSTTHIYNRTKNIASNGYTRSYTITYNGNGGTTPSEQISNYTFYRWAQYANGTGNTYTSGQTNVGNLSSTDGATVTLYAQWEPVAVNLPSTSRNAYTFGGWYNGTSRIGGIGDSYIPTTNTTLNAHWELIKTNVAGNIEWNDRK